MLSGLCAGIAAVMILGRTTAGTSTHGQLYELDAIAAVVVGGTLLVGGRGTIVGTVFGVLIFATLTNVFMQNNLTSSVQPVAKGVIIVSRCCCSSASPSRPVERHDGCRARRRRTIAGSGDARLGHLVESPADFRSSGRTHNRIVAK